MFILPAKPLLRIRKFFQQEVFIGSRESLTIYVHNKLSEPFNLSILFISFERHEVYEFDFPSYTDPIISTLFTVSRKSFIREAKMILCSLYGCSLILNNSPYTTDYETLSLVGIKAFKRYTFSEQHINYEPTD